MPTYYLDSGQEGAQDQQSEDGCNLFEIGTKCYEMRKFDMVKTRMGLWGSEVRILSLRPIKTKAYAINLSLFYVSNAL
jgi:hypothetical protein